MEGTWVSLRIAHCHCNRLLLLVIIFTLCKFTIGPPDSPEENTMGKLNMANPGHKLINDLNCKLLLAVCS